MYNILFLIILLFSFPTQALNCGETPSCSSLGYSFVDIVDCPSDGYLYCPFDKTYKKCVVKGKKNCINCDDYPLSSCPLNAAICTQCGKTGDFKYKIVACKTGYGAEDPLNCTENTCEAYTLTACPNRATCSECFNISANTTTYKFDGCRGDYTVAEDGQSCVFTGGGTPCEVGDVYYLDKTCGEVGSFVANPDNPPIGVVFYIEEDRSGGKIVNLKDLKINSTTYTFDPTNPYSGTNPYFGLYYKDFPGITNYTSGTGTGSLYEAFKNNNADLYDGKTNTAIISAIDFNDSYNNCKNGTYTEGTQNYARYCVPTAANAALAFYPVPQAKGTNVGEGNWYLPAIGELAQLYGTDVSQMTDSSGTTGAVGDVKTKVNTTLAALGSSYASKLTDSYYWSSSEYNSNHSWMLSMSNGGRFGNPKYDYNYVRVILAF